MMSFANFSRKLGAVCLWQHQKNIVTLTTRTFKSDLSLDKLYPASKQQLFTPPNPKPELDKFNGFIPLDQLEITYDRSSGPGGQNVNKVATKVDLRFHVSNANWINEEVKEQLQKKYTNKINREGFLIIKSDTTRYQQLNLADALEKLRTMIRDSSKSKEITLSAEKQERIRKNHERRARERLLIKREQSNTKAGRQSPKVDF